MGQWRPDPTVNRGPQEHKEPEEQGSQSQSSRTEWLGFDPSTLQPFAAGVLEKQDMAPPAAEPPAKQCGGKKHQREQHQARIDHTFANKRHGLTGFDGRDRGLGPNPVGDVQENQSLHNQEDVPSLPPRSNRSFKGFLLLLVLRGRSEKEAMGMCCLPCRGPLEFLFRSFSRNE